MKWLAFAALILTISNPVFALEFRFGPEFTVMPFGSNATIAQLAFHIKKHLIDDQPEGAKFTFRRDGVNVRDRLTSPNGWQLSYYQDSGGLELLTNPMTIQQFKKYKNDIQDAVFASASVCGYFPALWTGGGHINIDVTNFHDRPMLFRNFIVDLLNHNELFMGIFEYNGVSTTVSMPHELASTSDIPAAIEMIEVLRRSHNFTFFTVVDTLQRFLKGHSFAFNKIWDDRRLEIRAVRPQASMDVWIHQIELLEARINYLEKFRGPIPYKPRVPWSNSKVRDGKPPVDPQEALKSFYVYVRESGLPWQDHRDYLWPQWIRAQENESISQLERFEQSEWFLEQEKQQNCESRLTGEAL